MGLAPLLDPYDAYSDHVGGRGVHCVPVVGSVIAFARNDVTDKRAPSADGAHVKKGLQPTTDI